MALLAMVVAASSACRNQPGSDGGNGATKLTAQEKAAIDTVVMQLENATSAISGSIDGLTSVDRNANGQFGACPTVTYAVAGGVGTVKLDYPDGCRNVYYPDATISGAISVAFDLNTPTLEVTVTFTDFIVEGKVTNGALRLQRGSGQDFRTWDGSIDITISGVGSIQGGITVKIDTLQQSITIDPASLTLVDAAGTSHDVAVSGLIIKPVANGNFVPEAGTATFEVPSTAPTGPATLTIVVTFDANSPVDGTVSVKVGDSPAVEYKLPGF